MIVILYIMDSLRADFLSCYGCPQETSPNIDSLARESVLFLDAFSQSTWTRASGASILTSTYPSAHGILNTGDYFPLSIDSLPAVLQRRGFRTFAITTMRNISPHFGFGDGFDQFIEVYRNEKLAGKRILRSEENGLPVCTSEDINTVLFPILEECGKRDTFVFIWSLDTHDPYFHRDERLAHFSPPSTELVWARQIVNLNDPRDVERLKLLYKDMIFHNDHHLGNLIQKLKEVDLFEQTFLILTSDHGEAFGEHGANSHGGLPYEELIRIPLIFKFPRGDFRGRVPGMVQHIDLAPTILDSISSSPYGSFAQGKSALPLLRTGTKINDFAVIETQVFAGLAKSSALRTDEFKYIEIRRAESPSRKWFRGGKGLWPFHWFERTPRLLFSLKDDPGEQQSLVGSHPRVAKGLSSKLSRVLKENEVFRKGLVRSREKPCGVDPEVAEQLKALGYFE